jgi:hypothetical protein
MSDDVAFSRERASRKATASAANASILYEAIDELSINWWIEPTSFIIFESDRTRALRTNARA